MGLLGKTRFKFYDIRRLFAAYPNCQYYVVIGERSNGKTFSALDYCLENYMQNGETFAYVRRFAEDTKKSMMNQLFSGHENLGRVQQLTDGEWTNIDCTAANFRFMRQDEERKTPTYSDPIGYVFSIAQSQRYKSISYPTVSTIVFDEFMSRAGYLPNEFAQFTELLSTIIRQRENVRVILLGNTVNRYCPYFEQMGLNHVSEQEQGTTEIYSYGDSDLRVAVEYCKHEKGTKGGLTYFAFDNPQLEMIRSGAWEMAIYPHLEKGYKPKDIVERFWIEFGRDILKGHIVCDESGLYLFIYPAKAQEYVRNESGINPKIGDTIVYTTFPSTRQNFLFALQHHHDKLSQLILDLYQAGKVFYANNTDGEVFRNFIMWGERAYDVRKK